MINPNELNLWLKTLKSQGHFAYQDVNIDTVEEFEARCAEDDHEGHREVFGGHTTDVSKDSDDSDTDEEEGTKNVKFFWNEDGYICDAEGCHIVTLPLHIRERLAKGPPEHFLSYFFNNKPRLNRQNKCKEFYHYWLTLNSERDDHMEIFRRTCDRLGEMGHPKFLDFDPDEEDIKICERIRSEIAFNYDDPVIRPLLQPSTPGSQAFAISSFLCQSYQLSLSEDDMEMSSKFVMMAI